MSLDCFQLYCFLWCYLEDNSIGYLNLPPLPQKQANKQNKKYQTNKQNNNNNNHNKKKTTTVLSLLVKRARLHFFLKVDWKGRAIQLLGTDMYRFTSLPAVNICYGTLAALKDIPRDTPTGKYQTKPIHG